MERKINRALVITLVLAVIFGAAAYLVRGSPHTAEASGELRFPALDYIEMDLRRLDVSLIPYDGDEIILDYMNDRPLETEVGDNTLTVTESSSFVFSLFAGKKAEFGVKLYLPKRIYREITVYSATGDINIGKVDSKLLSAETESGDIRAENMVFVGAFSTVKGDIFANMDFVADGTVIKNRRGDTELVFPPNSSAAVDFSTKDGDCINSVTKGQQQGSYLYAWRGGEAEIDVNMDHGTLTLREREE